MNFFLKKYASDQKITFNIFYLKFKLEYDVFFIIWYCKICVFYYLILQNF